MPKEYHVRKASPIATKEAKDAVLHTHDVLDDTMSMQDTRNEMDADADIVVDALTGHLPQGVVDRVTARLMARAASNLIVNFNAR